MTQNSAPDINCPLAFPSGFTIKSQDHRRKQAKRPRTNITNPFNYLIAQDQNSFIKLKCTNRNEGFNNISPIKINKALRQTLGLAQDQFEIEPTKSGELILAVKQPTLIHRLNNLQDKRLLGIELDIQIEASLDTFLNRCKGVITSRSWDSISIDELKDDLKDIDVVDVYRITSFKNNKIYKTNKYILTFNKTKLPHAINTGYHMTKVEPYLPNPTTCRKCWRHNLHTTKKCKNIEICPNCGKNDHKLDNCLKFTKCPNCKGTNHTAMSKGCPEYIKAKKVNDIMALNVLTKNMATRKMADLLRNKTFLPQDLSNTYLTRHPDTKIPKKMNNSDKQNGSGKPVSELNKRLMASKWMTDQEKLQIETETQIETDTQIETETQMEIEDSQNHDNTIDNNKKNKKQAQKRPREEFPCSTRNDWETSPINEPGIIPGFQKLTRNPNLEVNNDERQINDYEMDTMTSNQDATNTPQPSKSNIDEINKTNEQKLRDKQLRELHRHNKKSKDINLGSNSSSLVDIFLSIQNSSDNDSQQTIEQTNKNLPSLNGANNGNETDKPIYTNL